MRKKRVFKLIIILIYILYVLIRKMSIGNKDLNKSNMMINILMDEISELKKDIEKNNIIISKFALRKNKEKKNDEISNKDESIMKNEKKCSDKCESKCVENRDNVMNNNLNVLGDNFKCSNEGKLAYSRMLEIYNAGQEKQKCENVSEVNVLDVDVPNKSEENLKIYELPNIIRDGKIICPSAPVMSSSDVIDYFLKNNKVVQSSVVIKQMESENSVNDKENKFKLPHNPYARDSDFLNISSNKDLKKNESKNKNVNDSTGDVIGIKHERSGGVIVDNEVVNSILENNCNISTSIEDEKRKILREDETIRLLFNKTDEGVLQEFKFPVGNGIEMCSISAFVSNKTHAETYGQLISIGETSVSTNVFKVFRNSSLSIGMVMSLEPDKYSRNKIANSNIHIPFAVGYNTLFPKIVYVIVSNFLGKKPKQITVGHEHGNRENKCHLQICVKFYEALSRFLFPGYVNIRYKEQEFKLLFMQQMGRNSKALAKYCEKGKDFSRLFNGDTDDKDTFDGKGVYYEICRKKNEISIDEAREMIILNDPKGYFLSQMNYERALMQIVRPKLPPFYWVFPPKSDYIWKVEVNVDGSEKKKLFMDVFINWFNNYCLYVGPSNRRKALCLYSDRRAIGKTWFVEHLVNHPGYILKYRNTFVTKPIDPQIKLLLLDDMRMIDKRNFETWKGLVASENTTMRDTYVNDMFEKSVPCIITTNNFEMFTTFCRSRMFNTQVVSIKVNDCLMSPKFCRYDLLKEERYTSSEDEKDMNFLVKELMEISQKNGTYNYLFN